jgi:hypothetical protein
MAKNGKTGKVVGVGNGIGTGSGKGTVTATIAVADSPSEKKAQNQKPRSRMTADEIVKEAGEFAKLPMEERWQAQKSGKFTGFLPNDLIYAEISLRDLQTLPEHRSLANHLSSCSTTTSSIRRRTTFRTSHIAYPGSVQ